jgi:uncharacterized delta-60 repeat protein
MVLSWLAACMANLALADPGDLDTSFSTDGRVFSSFSNSADYALAVAVQADGKIVAAGRCGGDFCIVRYTLTGGLDTSFNGNGRVSSVFGASGNEARALVLQPDGKILVAGGCSDATVTTEICLARFTAAGALDTTFNATGTARLNAGAEASSARSLALQGDGKILVGAFCDNSTPRSAYCVLRLTPSGALDASFDGDGQVLTLMGDAADNDQLHTVLAQADGKIVASGRCGVPPNLLFCVARYTSTGALDATFGVGGKVRFIAGTSGLTTAVGAAALQPDGKIVLASICLNSGYQLCIARLSAGGALDTSFNTDGIVVTTFNSNDSYIGGQGISIALQADGKIVATRPCSSSSDPFNEEFCVARYHGSGALDTNFDVDGRVLTSMGTAFDQPNAVAIHSDGKIVVAGQCAGTAGSDICVARYQGGPFDARNCSLDIDGDGKTLATVDGLIAARVMLGLTGNAVTNGISFALHAARDEWGTHSARDIRKYLITQCGMVIP